MWIRNNVVLEKINRKLWICVFLSLSLSLSLFSLENKVHTIQIKLHALTTRCKRELYLLFQPNSMQMDRLYSQNEWKPIDGRAKDVAASDTYFYYDINEFVLIPTNIDVFGFCFFCFFASYRFFPFFPSLSIFLTLSPVTFTQILMWIWLMA